MNSLDRAKTVRVVKYFPLCNLSHRIPQVFFGNVTHELRTPLQLILGPVEDLLSDSSLASNNSAQSRLKLVLRHGRRLLQLVNSLLDFVSENNSLACPADLVIRRDSRPGVSWRHSVPSTSASSPPTLPVSSALP